MSSALWFFLQDTVFDSLWVINGTSIFLEIVKFYILPYILLECDTESLDKWFLMYWRNRSPSPQRFQGPWTLKAKHLSKYQELHTQQCSDTYQKTWIFNYQCEKLETHIMYTTSYSYSTFLTGDPKMDSIIPGVLFTCGQIILFHTL